MPMREGFSHIDSYVSAILVSSGVLTKTALIFCTLS